MLGTVRCLQLLATLGHAEYSSYMFWRGVQYFFGGGAAVPPLLLDSAHLLSRCCPAVLRCVLLL